ncbi:MAG: 16S rRNA (uracil(1498)-N(3))-methyltransferase [Bacteroidales bacterium]|jgi:16S rRNA (uracil1498-N3)-methyltransferase|nr:16S rRNA (uracil(1498)-N(3))-methyltransferase [Bacteroidales bacterium]
MHLFYTPDINEKIYSLSEEESKHCMRVLRLKKNDKINLIDGKGGLYTARIIDTNPKKCILEVLEYIQEYRKKDFYLHIAIAPTKNIGRFEWFLEKATEIGIDEITPLLCEHSERKIIKLERLNKVITAAVKQSLKAYHPKINNLTKYSDFILANNKGNKYIAHCEENAKHNLKDIYKANTDALILIGPEGDFSSKEIKQAKVNYFTEIGLGNSRLRTETAGIVACHTINVIND